MTFTVDPTHLCPCGGDPYLEPPLNPAGSGIWKRQWTSLSLGAFSTDTRNEQVKGWAYFTLVVTLYSPTAGPGNTPCEVTETRTGFTGIQLF